MGQKSQNGSDTPITPVGKGQLAAYERKRFEAMEELTSTAIDKNLVIEMCQYVDCSCFHSVAEERYLSGVCGYVLCSNSLSPKERVWFCSPLCHRKYRYLLAQLSEEPFWACLKTERRTLEFLDSLDTDAANRSGRELKPDLDDITCALSAVNLNGSSCETSADEQPAEIDSDAQDGERSGNGDTESRADIVSDEEHSTYRDNAHTQESTASSLASTSELAPAQGTSLTAEERLERIRARYFEKTGSQLKAKSKPPALIDPKPLPISSSNPAATIGGKLTHSEYEENCRMIHQWFKGVKLNWLGDEKPRQVVLPSKEATKHVRFACQADLQDQKRQRQAIFYAGISKSLPFLFRSIGLELTSAYKDDLKVVISSLQLDAKNIALKPSQWTLTAHFLLSIISFKRPELMQSMKSHNGEEFCNELLSGSGCSSETYRKFIDDMQSLCN